jgi:hypothetical protein
VTGYFHSVVDEDWSFLEYDAVTVCYCQLFLRTTMRMEAENPSEIPVITSRTASYTIRL